MPRHVIPRPEPKRRELHGVEHIEEYHRLRTQGTPQERLQYLITNHNDIFHRDFNGREETTHYGYMFRHDDTPEEQANIFALLPQPDQQRILNDFQNVFRHNGALNDMPENDATNAWHDLQQERVHTNDLPRVFELLNNRYHEDFDQIMDHAEVVQETRESRLRARIERKQQQLSTVVTKHDQLIIDRSLNMENAMLAISNHSKALDETRKSLTAKQQLVQNEQQELARLTSILQIKQSEQATSPTPTNQAALLAAQQSVTVQQQKLQTAQLIHNQAQAAVTAKTAELATANAQKEQYQLTLKAAEETIEQYRKETQFYEQVQKEQDLSLLTPGNYFSADPELFDDILRYTDFVNRYSVRNAYDWSTKAVDKDFTNAAYFGRLVLSNRSIPHTNIKTGSTRKIENYRGSLIHIHTIEYGRNVYSSMFLVEGGPEIHGLMKQLRANEYLAKKGNFGNVPHLTEQEKTRLINLPKFPFFRFNNSYKFHFNERENLNTFYPMRLNSDRSKYFDTRYMSEDNRFYVFNKDNRTHEVTDIFLEVEEAFSEKGLLNPNEMKKLSEQKEYGLINELSTASRMARSHAAISASPRLAEHIKKLLSTNQVAYFQSLLYDDIKSRRQAHGAKLAEAEPAARARRDREHAELEAKVKTARNALDGHETALKNLQAALATAQVTLNTQNSTLATLEQQERQLQQQLATTQGEAQRSVQLQLEQKQQEIARVREQSQAKQQQLSQYQAEIVGLNTQKGKDEALLAGAQDARKNIETTYDTQIATIDKERNALALDIDSDVNTLDDFINHSQPAEVIKSLLEKIYKIPRAWTAGAAHYIQRMQKQVRIEAFSPGHAVFAAEAFHVVSELLKSFYNVRNHSGDHLIERVSTDPTLYSLALDRDFQLDMGFDLREITTNANAKRAVIEDERNLYAQTLQSNRAALQRTLTDKQIAQKVYQAEDYGDITVNEDLSPNYPSWESTEEKITAKYEAMADKRIEAIYRPRSFFELFNSIESEDDAIRAVEFDMGLEKKSTYRKFERFATGEMHHRALEEVARYHNRTFPTQYEPLAIEPSWKTQDELLPKLAAGQATSKEKETLSEANAQIRTTFDKYINRDAPMGEGHYVNENMDYYMFPLDITGLMPHINEHLDEFGKKTIYAKYGDEYYEGAINSIQDRTLREHFQTMLITHPKERPVSPVKIVEDHVDGRDLQKFDRYLIDKKKIDPAEAAAEETAINESIETITPYERGAKIKSSRSSYIKDVVIPNINNYNATKLSRFLATSGHSGKQIDMEILNLRALGERYAPSVATAIPAKHTELAEHIHEPDTVNHEQTARIPYRPPAEDEPADDFEDMLPNIKIDDLNAPNAEPQHHIDEHVPARRVATIAHEVHLEGHPSEVAEPLNEAQPRSVRTREIQHLAENIQIARAEHHARMIPPPIHTHEDTLRRFIRTPVYLQMMQHPSFTVEHLASILPQAEWVIRALGPIRTGTAIGSNRLLQEEGHENRLPAVPEHIAITAINNLAVIEPRVTNVPALPAAPRVEELPDDTPTQVAAHDTRIATTNNVPTLIPQGQARVGHHVMPLMTMQIHVPVAHTAGMLPAALGTATAVFPDDAPSPHSNEPAGEKRRKATNGIPIMPHFGVIFGDERGSRDFYKMLFNRSSRAE